MHDFNLLCDKFMSDVLEHKMSILDRKLNRVKSKALNILNGHT